LPNISEKQKNKQKKNKTEIKCWLY